MALQRNGKRRQHGDAKPMDWARLRTIIKDRENRADAARPEPGYFGDAMAYYTGVPQGKMRPDRSNIEMMELFSTIEWIKPVLAKIFFGGPSVVKFTARGDDDVKQAEQETDYVNHVILNQNDGFTTMFNWFTDAMLSRNAYVFAYWEKKEDTTEERYEDQTEDIYSQYANDENSEVELIGMRQVEVNGGAIDLYTFTVMTRVDKGKVCIDTVPPERVRIHGKWRKTSLKDCPFVQYAERQTISELREMGFDVPDTVNDGDDDEYVDEVERMRTGDLSMGVSGDDDDIDPASREVTVTTTFMRVDYDGDGIAELRRVLSIGDYELYNEADDIVAMACLSPILIPHRHQGMSFYDIIKQLQDLKSQIARGLIDNMHLANNGRWFITDNVELTDFFNSRPNAPVRVDGPTVAGQAQPFNHPVLGNQMLSMLEYADSAVENWTGASPRTLQGQNFDGNSINKTASGISQIMSAALARIELIARIFAETGIRDLMAIVHSLTLSHARVEQIVRLRGSFVSVNPAEWKERESLDVSTGLGTGDAAQKVQTLQALATAQQALIAAEAPITDWSKLYATMAKMTEEMGYADPSEFWIDPAQAQEQQQGQGLEGLPPSQRQAVMAQIGQIVDAQMKARENELRAEMDAKKIDGDLQRALLDNETSSANALLKGQIDLARALISSGDAENRAAETAFSAAGQT